MTVEQIINKRRQETMERQGLELVQTLRVRARVCVFVGEEEGVCVGRGGCV